MVFVRGQAKIGGVHHQDMRAMGDTRDRCDIAEKNEIELVAKRLAASVFRL
jgi:hypothetical protein